MKNSIFILLLSLLFFCCKKPIKKSGEELYVKHACHTCHSLDGTRMIGPSFKGIYGKIIELNGGISKIANEEYLIESILEPSKEIVKNFPNLMGSYKLLLNESEVNLLVDFIKKQ